MLIYFLVFDRNLPLTKEECQSKLKQEFLKNKHISDVRIIDMLVIKVYRHVYFILLLIHILRIRNFDTWL